MPHLPYQRPPCPSPVFDTCLIVAYGLIVALVAALADQGAWVLGGLIVAAIGAARLIWLGLTS